MTFVIEGAVLCALFSLVIYLRVGRNPISGILSYPTAIRKRVESLPQYQGIAKRSEQKHLYLKVIGALLLALVLAVVVWFSGMRDFWSAFLYGFGLFSVVNLWDLIVLDWVWFCHSKRFRIPGTEDMVKEYRDPWFHLKAFFLGCMIGLVVSLLAAGCVAIIRLFRGIV